ncbi:hypothetical protein B0J18DRAFT_61340 [Chaetomium sp. MPI-SDFR-AT-0129]|nr:hypothetical protein B0J18DRAFT_61340 [Chaetomium sp. MPI-SDFR-AT-0129]
MNKHLARPARAVTLTMIYSLTSARLLSSVSVVTKGHDRAFRVEDNKSNCVSINGWGYVGRILLSIIKNCPTVGSR